MTERWTSSVSRETLRRCLAEGLGISDEHAQVLVVLLEHQGEPLTSQQMCRLVNTHRPLRLNVFQERVRLIREVMGRDAIAGFRTPGEREGRRPDGSFGFLNSTYSLSEDGIAQCRRALVKVAEALPLGVRAPLRNSMARAS